MSKALCLSAVALMLAPFAPAAPAPWLSRGPVYQYRTCPDCWGTGDWKRHVMDSTGEVWWSFCRRCNGWCALRTGPCDYCGGTGREKADFSDVPPGGPCHACKGAKVAVGRPVPLRSSQLSRLRLDGKLSGRPAEAEDWSLGTSNAGPR